jgi:hypothetical protein
LRLGRFGKLNLYINAPSDTPAIRQLTSILGMSALWSAVGMAALMFPPYLYLLQARALIEVQMVLAAIAVTTGLVVVIVAVLPHLGIYIAIISYKRKLLDRISLHISQVTVEHAHSRIHAYSSWTTEEINYLQMLLSLHDTIYKSPDIPLNGATVMRYVLSAATAALPYLMNLLTSKSA